MSIEHAKALLAEAQTIVHGAKSAGRPMTAQERREAEGLLDQVNQLKDTAALTARVDEMNASFTASPATKGLGAVLLEAGLGRRPDGLGISVKGNPTVEVSSFAVFGAKVQTLPATGDVSPRPADSIEYIGRDERWMFGNMRQIGLGGDLSIRDFRQSVRTPAGTVERDPAAVTGKATLASTVTAVTTAVRQHAIIADGIPNAVLESMDGFREFADSELRFQVQKSLDAHVYTQCNASATFGTSGTGLVAQLRNAVTALEADGFNADLVVLNPTDAAALDLTVDAAGHYLFAVRATGDSSPLWGLKVVTRTSAAGTEPPLVVDTSRVGVLFMGTMRFDLDPFSGVSGSNFENNTTDIRCELNALMHVRSAKAARRVAAT